MSQRDFQAALADLVTDPNLRRRVRTKGASAFASDLTDLERYRLVAVARDPGLEVTATLIKGFRLGKIISLLPLTRALLGDKRLRRELRLFWAATPPDSFYPVVEVLAFCDHLLERLRSGLQVNYLEDVVAYERAIVELRRARPASSPAMSQVVCFRYDPACLFTCLAAGRRPRRIPQLPCVLVGTVDDTDTIVWTPVRPPSSELGGQDAIGSSPSKAT